jgi:predicted nucleic acid-binding protein
MILVDSDVLIAHLRKVEAARDWLVWARRSEGRLSASVVTYVEITGGMRSAERAAVERLFEAIDFLDVDQEVAARAGELQRAHRRSPVGIGIADLLVAATAQVHELQLATLNVKHFPMFRGLKPPFRLPL